MKTLPQFHQWFTGFLAVLILGFISLFINIDMNVFYAMSSLIFVAIVLKSQGAK